jgi:hypothetical protein
MEIRHLINDTYQLIALSDNSILFQGTLTECACQEEHIMYRQFMSYGF